MSLINFLNPKLKPVIECDAVYEDGYSAANLIADDGEHMTRGFMAFSVTKPPVEIVFEFPKAIDLKVIKLWNKHGPLRSTAFEVYGKSEGIWERVANVRDLSKDVEFVTFCYQSDYNSRNSEQQHGEKVFFFRTAHKLLSNTNCIKLIIRATYKCPPVLRKIQIWGLPARSLDKADRELIKSIWHDITHFSSYQQQNQNSVQQCQKDDSNNGNNHQRSPSRCVPELNKDSTLQIPEDFLDAITWELMIFPTVLPSGKVVDQSTIDRHSEEEAKWGRMPSDPFTGLEFTMHRKAILNIALKARIEKFFAENSEHFMTIPRSLGSSRARRSRNRHASQIANLFQMHNTADLSPSGTVSSLLSHKKTATATLSSSENQTDLIENPPVKRPRLSDQIGYHVSPDTMFTLHSIKGENISEKLLNIMASTATQTSATVTASFTNAYKIGPKSVQNEDSLTSEKYSNNIDRVLQQALHQITRFTQIPLRESKGNSADLENVCIKCQTADYFYKIRNCGHLVCRRCLIGLTQEKRCICNESLKTGDIERFHKL